MAKTTQNKNDFLNNSYDVDSFNKKSQMKDDINEDFSLYSSVLRTKDKRTTSYSVGKLDRDIWPGNLEPDFTMKMRRKGN